MDLRRWCFVLLLGATAAFGSRLSFEEYRAAQDSPHRLPTQMQSRWLATHCVELPRWSSSTSPYAESGGLRMVGKWGRGPASGVTGRDTLVALVLGSEVALLSFAEPDSLRVLSEIQFSSQTVRVGLS
jgi:hypothetical protein